MRLEELSFFVDIKKEIEFLFNGKKYTVTYGTEESGTPYIAFGRVYDTPDHYDSLNAMLNHAKIENHFLREIIPSITPVS